VAHLRRAHALARSIGYRRFSGMIVANVAELHRIRGEAAQALACAAHALGVFASLNDVYGVLYAAGTVAMVRHEQGALDDAEQLLEHLVARAGSADNRRFRCDALLELARVRQAGGRPAEAADAAGRAAELAGRIGHPEAGLEARLLLIRVGATTNPSRARDGDELDRLLAVAGDDAERASVRYVQWQVDPRRVDARRDAARLYREIALRTDRADARRRLAELTGERLPEPDRLPAVLQDRLTQPASPSDVVAQASAALSGLGDEGGPAAGADAAVSFSV
jgi:tetratricopeptide (TPR) repeat protein